MRAAAWFVSIIVGMVPGLAFAGTYWVSPDGTAAWGACEGAAPLDGVSGCALDTANTNALAGDTVVLRAGTYVDQWIEPANSGTGEDQRIVFTGYDGEEIVIRDAPYGIYLYKQSYITVEGIDFVSLRRFFRIYAGHYNVISHCDFDQRSDDSGDWAGAIIADDFNDDTDGSEDSTHNWVHHCSFFRWAWGAFDEHRGALLNIGTDQSAGGEYGEALDCGSRCCVGGTCESAPGTGGGGGEPGPNVDTHDGSDESGCSCRLVGSATESGPSGSWLWLLALAAPAVHRRPSRWPRRRP